MARLLQADVLKRDIATLGFKREEELTEEDLYGASEGRIELFRWLLKR